MSLPRFLDRVVDATAPVLGGLDRDAVRAKLELSSVTLVGGARAETAPSRDGFLLAANLLARLYPRIQLQGPDELVRAAETEIILVNPRAHVAVGDVEQTATTLGYEIPVDDGVSVSARGWNVYVDSNADVDDPAAGAAALVAAALGVSELFRVIFADELVERGRHGIQSSSFNLVTLGEPSFDLPVPATVEAGEFRLVGAGAVGQAAAKTLAVAGVRGTIVVVDDENVALSNLQRYVLTRDSDVGAVKVDLLRDRLAKSDLAVVPIKAKWHVGLVATELATLVALDSPEDRIGVQASLPGPIYNAWTQPADVGWSRHEHFGEEPCLACMYWPQGQTLSRHEQIATVFRQDPLRVLSYLVHRVPIGLPLPPGGVPAVPGFEAVPVEIERWMQTPLVNDIAVAAGIDVAELGSWRDRPLADVYQDGICGGALLHLNVGEAPREVLVPLAHQSALAGVMLAAQFIAAKVPELAAARPSAVEARYDVLAGLPQVFARPRARTPNCLCGDAIFLAVYGGKLDEKALASRPTAESSTEAGVGVDGSG